MESPDGIDSAVTPVSHDIGPDAISLLITASLVLLASKIMELGRRTTEEAEEMRRDAELVV